MTAAGSILKAYSANNGFSNQADKIYSEQATQSLGQIHMTAEQYQFMYCIAGLTVFLGTVTAGLMINTHILVGVEDVVKKLRDFQRSFEGYVKDKY